MRYMNRIGEKLPAKVVISSKPNLSTEAADRWSGPQQSVRQESAMAVLSSLIRTAANLAPRRLLHSTKVNTFNNTVTIIQNKVQSIFLLPVNLSFRSS